MITLQMLFDEMFQGEYDFEHFLRCSVEEEVIEKKFDDKSTFIASPTLRAYHRFIQRYVINYMQVKSGVIFSYRKEVNVADAVRKHSKSRYFYQTDLLDFFQSISSILVSRTMTNNTKNMPFSDSEKLVDHFVNLVTFRSHLARGFTTSPSLSNACLFEFDNNLLDYCEAHHLVYTRYSDDIIISGENSDAVKKGSIFLINLLSDLYGESFTINQKKSKFMRIGRKIKLLGMVILPDGSVSIDLSMKRKIETMLHFYSTDSFKFLDIVHDDLETGTKMLAGYINYVNAVDKKFLDKLCRKYGVGIVDRLLHIT